MISSAYSSRTTKRRLEHPFGLVRLVDRERVVRDELADRVGDADEKRVERLLREHLVEDVGEPPVRLDESRVARTRLRRQAAAGGMIRTTTEKASVQNGPEASLIWRYRAAADASPLSAWECGFHASSEPLDAAARGRDVPRVPPLAGCDADGLRRGTRRRSRDARRRAAGRPRRSRRKAVRRPGRTPPRRSARARPGSTGAPPTSRTR